MSALLAVPPVRRWVLILLTLGCSLPASASAAATAPLTLNLAHRLPQAQVAAFTQLVDRFNASQKATQVRLVPHDAQSTADQPHLTLLPPGEMGGYAARPAPIRPLHEVMKEARETFNPASLGNDLRAGVSDARGQLLALPVALSTPLLYINKDAFRRAGLNPEQPPRTWREVLAAADKLEAAGYACAYTSAWPTWVHIDNASAWNGAEVTDERGRLAFNGLIQVKHIAMLSSWAKSHFFSYFGREDEADLHFTAGECGMLTSGSYLQASLRQAPALDIGTAPLPYHDDAWGAPRTTLADGAALWVSSGKRREEYRAVAQFVRYLMTPEPQAEMASAGSFLPMSPSARNLVRNRLQRAELAGLDLAYAQLQGRASHGPLRLSQLAPLRRIIDEELEAVWSNRKNPKEALDSAVLRGNAALPAALKALPR